MYKFYTYIIFTKKNKLFDIGVTTDMKGTLMLLNENKALKPKLVYYETFETSNEAVKREIAFNKVPLDIITQFIKENNPSISDLSNLLIINYKK